MDHANDADADDTLVPAEDETMSKTQPGGVINPSKDGPTGGWGTAARWFILALLVIVLVWGMLYMHPF